MDHATDGGSDSGLSRRDVLKRTAVAGAVMWTVPLVTTVNSAAGAQAIGSPLPSQDGCNCRTISYVAFVVQTPTGGSFRYKWQDGAFVCPPGNLPDCDLDSSTTWTGAADCSANSPAVGVSVTACDDTPRLATFSVPSGSTFTGAQLHTASACFPMNGVGTTVITTPCVCTGKPGDPAPPGVDCVPLPG